MEKAKLNWPDGSRSAQLIFIEIFLPHALSKKNGVGHSSGFPLF